LKDLGSFRPLDGELDSLGLWEVQLFSYRGYRIQVLLTKRIGFFVFPPNGPCSLLANYPPGGKQKPTDTAPQS